MDSAPVRSLYHERPDYRVDVLARTNVMTAWLGQTCLARSSACLTVDEQDHGLVVYFPRDSVDFSHLEPTDQRTVCPFKGRPSGGGRPAAPDPASRGAIRSRSVRSPGWPATSPSIRTRSG